MYKKKTHHENKQIYMAYTQIKQGNTHIYIYIYIYVILKLQKHNIQFHAGISCSKKKYDYTSYCMNQQ